MKKLLLSLILLNLCFLAQAQSVTTAVKNSDGTYSLIEGYKNRIKVPYNNEHEFRIGLGVYPYNPPFTESNEEIPPNYSLEDEINRIGYYEGAKLGTPSLNIAYSYRFQRWLEVGLNFTYKMTYRRSRSTLDDSKVGTDNSYYISIAPVIRISWLNREYYRLYSAASLGLLIDSYVYDNPRQNYSDRILDVTGQVTFLGISVGKELFGYAEVLGIGTQGWITAGIGYRF